MSTSLVRSGFENNLAASLIYHFFKKMPIISLIFSARSHPLFRAEILKSEPGSGYGKGLDFNAT
jgi:hypothetical protein